MGVQMMLVRGSSDFCHLIILLTGGRKDLRNQSEIVREGSFVKCGYEKNMALTVINCNN